MKTYMVLVQMTSTAVAQLQANSYQEALDQFVQQLQSRSDGLMQELLTNQDVEVVEPKLITNCKTDATVLVSSNVETSNALVPSFRSELYRPI